jgi:glycosyltransferase involved in cell wall biosynthesis
MKIAINGKFLGAKLEGMPRVGREILRQFDALIREPRYAGLEIVTLAPQGVENPGLQNIAFRNVGRFQGVVWEQLEFGFHSLGHYTVNFTGTASVLRRNGLVVIHDAQFFSTPKSHSWKSKYLYSVITPMVGHAYRDICTVSDYALREIRQYHVVSRPDVHIVHNAADHMANFVPDDGIIDRFSLRDRPFILSSSYVQTHKNVRTILEAYGTATTDGPLPPLVLFGSNVAADFAARDVPVPDGVIFTGRISNEELASLMRHATLFLFPSTTEGFGIPPLEAMTLGCPTLCSDQGAMPEVCGDGALYAEALNPADWSAKIRAVLALTPDARAALVARGRERSATFTWRRAAEGYLDILLARAALQRG